MIPIEKIHQVINSVEQTDTWQPDDITEDDLMKVPGFMDLLQGLGISLV